MIQFIDIFHCKSILAKHRSLLSPYLVLGGIIVGQSVYAQTGKNNEADGAKFYVADGVSYDSNIYHVASGTQLPINQLGEEASREDTVNRLSAGLDGNWLFARQALDLNLRVDDNRYKNNKNLNHVASHGDLDWAWALGGNLSGHLGGEYTRALANFTSDRLLTKDIVETYVYFGEADFAIGPSWTLKVGARQSRASHSDVDRQLDNHRGSSGNAGLEYQSKAGDLVGVDYRYTKSKYEGSQTSQIPSTSIDSDYKESLASTHFKYAFTVKTALLGNAGYLKRDYVDPANEGFSGDVWHLTLQWQPTSKTQFDTSVWRELRAYLDAEADYYVSNGVGIEPGWRPTEKLKLSLSYAHEDQDFLGSVATENISFGRKDRVNSGQLNLSYTPMEWLQVALTGRREQRSSNKPLLAYSDNLASLELRLIF